MVTYLLLSALGSVVLPKVLQMLEEQLDDTESLRPEFDRLGGQDAVDLAVVWAKRLLEET